MSEPDAHSSGLRVHGGVAAISLVLSNLVPLAGVFLFGWDAAMIVLLYWVENLIVGFYNILKMTLLPMKPRWAHLGKLFLIPFFCVHFGGFCAVHGMFLSIFLKIGTNAPDGGDAGHYLPGPLMFLDLLFRVLVHLRASLPAGFAWSVVAIFLSHGVSFVQNFLLRGEYRVLKIDALMGAPYRRIVLMHITILLGGFAALALKSPAWMLALMVALKIMMDLRLHRKERREAGAANRMAED